MTGSAQSHRGAVEPGELPGKLAGSQAGLGWKPALCFIGSSFKQRRFCKTFCLRQIGIL